MNSTFRIARILGIDINVHATWIIALFLVAWSLSAGYFKDSYPNWQSSSYWLAGTFSALLLFVCVLLHEMAHSLLALAKGLPVHGITLFIFGGVSSIEMQDDEAHDEFLIAVVGPLSSLVLAGLAWLATQMLTSGEIASAVLQYLVGINVMLALFNLVPGFPLDGGRVLRSIIWGITGDFEKATRIAASVGQFIGYFLIAAGVVWLWSGQVFNGLWTAFIGWFLNSAAEASKVQTVTSYAFRGLTAADLLEPEPETLTPDTPVATFVRDHILRHGERALPVVFGERVLGIVSLSDVKRLPEAQWANTPVTSIMSRDVLAVAPTDDVSEGLRLLAEHDVHQVLVLDDGRLLGVLTRAHLVEYLQLREELGLRPSSRHGSGTALP